MLTENKSVYLLLKLVCF